MRKSENIYKIFNRQAKDLTFDSRRGKITTPKSQHEIEVESIQMEEITNEVVLTQKMKEAVLIH